MELQDWRKEPRKNYSNEFKLRMVELASQPGACVAQIAREMASMIMLFSNGSGSGRTKGVFRGVFR
nr:transposase [Escherichia coli]